MQATEPRPRERARIVLAGLAGGLVASLLILLQVIPYGLSRGLTAVDEIGHIDYAIELSVGHSPRWGEQYTQQTLLIADCAGSGFGPAGSCHPQERNPLDYWPNGWSYEAQQPPAGYLAHAVVARATGLMDPLEQLSWLRATSLLLTAVGLLALGALIGSLAPSGRIAFVSPIPVALVPIVVNSSQFVTNDAAALLAGVIASVPAALLLRRKELTPTILILGALSGVLVALMKSVALTVPLAILLWGLLNAWRTRPEGHGPQPTSLSRRLPPLALLGVLQLGAGLIATLGFMVLQQATSPLPSSDVMSAVLSENRSDGPPWSEWAVSLREILTLAFHGVEPVTEFRSALAPAVIGFGLVALTLVSLLPSSGPLKALNRLPAAIALAALAGTVAWTFGLYLWGGYSVAMPGRYLIALVPLLALIWMKGLERLRVAAWAIPVACVAAVIWMVWPILPLWFGWE